MARAALWRRLRRACRASVSPEACAAVARTRGAQPRRPMDRAGHGDSFPAPDNRSIMHRSNSYVFRQRSPQDRLLHTLPLDDARPRPPRPGCGMRPRTHGDRAPRAEDRFSAGSMHARQTSIDYRTRNPRNAAGERDDRMPRLRQRRPGRAIRASTTSALRAPSTMALRHGGSATAFPTISGRTKFSLFLNCPQLFRISDENLASCVHSLTMKK